MSKHTPGQWQRSIPPATKYPTIWSGRNKHVTYVAIGCFLTDDEVEANIRLIAAAPDLLSTLKRIIDRATAPMSNGDIDYSDVAAARAAIARATGQGATT